MRQALTIDLEDWFHVGGVEESLPPSSWMELPSRLEATTLEMLDMLSEHGSRATFFVLGWVAERYPRLVREIRDRGHEIGSHGHLHRRVYDLTPQGFAEDLDRSVEAIGRAAGVVPRAYRAPEWSMLRGFGWAYEILASRGFRTSSSVIPLTWVGSRFFPSGPHAVETPAGTVTEVPLTTVRALHERLPFTGGLSFRITPEWYIVRRLERARRRDELAIVYTHPCDLEDDLPEAPIPASRRVIQRFRRKVIRGRFERLLARFGFVPIEEALEGAPAPSPGEPSPEMRARWSRSFWISVPAYFILAPAAAVATGAALGPGALLIPPAAVALGYLKYATWRVALSRRRRRLAVDPAPAGDVSLLPRVPPEPADLSPHA